MMKKITLVLVLAALFCAKGFAQKNPYKEAEKAFSIKEYFAAIDWYKKAYTREKKAEKKAKILYRTAECYRHINQLNEAVTYYTKAIAAKYPDPMAYFYIGDIKKEQKLYNEAITEFEKYKKEEFLNLIHKFCLKLFFFFILITLFFHHFASLVHHFNGSVAYLTNSS